MTARERLATEFDRLTELPMLVLAVLFVPVLAVPALVELSESWNEAFFAADWTIWAVFAVELVIKTALASRRLEYLRSHWFDVLLVVLPFARPLRVARSARAFRALRALRLVSVIARTGHSLRAVLGAHGLHYALAMTALVVIAAGGAVAAVERDADGNIRDFGDGLWWAITTVTTVGYGDRFPVTAEGRAIAAFLMVLGVSLFSFVTANIAAYLSTQDATDASQLRDLEARLDRIEALLGQLNRSDEHRSS